MSVQAKESDQDLQCCDVYNDLLEFEKRLAAARKRTRSADYLDRKLVISDSTEFERHFENLSEAIARLLPYHTFYVDEIKSNRIHEEEEKILERKDRIKNIEESIMSVSMNSPSFTFNACKYGLIRAIHSYTSMDLDRHKKELSQLQALELAWKYPIENAGFSTEKPALNSSALPSNALTSSSAAVPMGTASHGNNLSSPRFDNSPELLYQNITPKSSLSNQGSNLAANYVSRHFYDASGIVGREGEVLPNPSLPNISGIPQNPNLETTNHYKNTNNPKSSSELYSPQSSDILKGEHFTDSTLNP
ncbi:synaptobrevin, adjacent duplicated protein [Cryptosporidium felis]|nr:synaptobrevin, adjacent duplicated protein [Cryptosporidium felis]